MYGIVSISSSGLQQLFKVCNDYYEILGLMFNIQILWVCILLLIRAKIVDSQYYLKIVMLICWGR